MTNLPNSEQTGNLDNIAVTRAEFRSEIGVLLEYIAQALGGVSGTYTSENVNPFSVELQGSPTIEIGAEPGTNNSSYRIANTQWVKRSGNYVGNNAPSNPVDGMLWIDKSSNPYTIRAYDGTEWDIVSGVPSGTRMLFQQTAAPTGWTKDTSINNRALRVTSGSVTTGGSVSFSNTFTARAVTGTVADHVLTEAQMPQHAHGLSQTPHNHTINDPGHAHSITAAKVFADCKSGDGDNECQNQNYSTGGNTTGISINNRSIAITCGNKGSSAGHNHGFTGTDLDFDLRYVDVIIASKN